jgi:hypothetical protein
MNTIREARRLVAVCRATFLPVNVVTSNDRADRINVILTLRKARKVLAMQRRIGDPAYNEDWHREAHVLYRDERRLFVHGIKRQASAEGVAERLVSSSVYGPDGRGFCSNEHRL